MIKRDELLNKIRRALKVHRIVCLLGPKGVGKKTLVDEIKKDYSRVEEYRPRNIFHYMALEVPNTSIYFARGLIIIDPIQRKPDFFQYLRYLHDQQFDQTFLILGDVDQKLIGQSSESLAGRIGYIEIPTLSILEADDEKKLLLQGGFPQSYLLSKADSFAWREEYMIMHIEYTLANIGLKYDRDIMKRLWVELGFWHGNIISYSKLSKKLEVSQPTIKKYITYLDESFMIRLLYPWYENMGKRQVRSPRVYYRDTGFLNYVFNIKTYKEMLNYPQNFFFKSFAMEEVIKANYNTTDKYDYFFWSLHDKNLNLDLLIRDRLDRVGFNFVIDKPTLTKEMLTLLKDLKLRRLTIIYPAGESFMLAENIHAISLREYVHTRVAELRIEL